MFLVHTESCVRYLRLDYKITFYIFNLWYILMIYKNTRILVKFFSGKIPPDKTYNTLGKYKFSEQKNVLQLYNVLCEELYFSKCYSGRNYWELWIVSCNFEMFSTSIFEFIYRVRTISYVCGTIHFRKYATSNITHIHILEHRSATR